MAKASVKNTVDEMDKPLSIWFILVIPVYVVVLLSVFLFPIAKDWGWFEAWAFITTFAINVLAISLLIKRIRASFATG
jgi:hypothetical protein